MKIIKTKHFPFGNYKAINLFGIVFTKAKLDAYEQNHELIHTLQMREMLYVFFYLWYGVEYVIVRFLHKKQSCAYHDVCFEEEAYINEMDLSYPSKREHYEWFKYIKARSWRR